MPRKSRRPADPLAQAAADFAAEAEVRRKAPLLLRYQVPVPGLDPAHDGLRIAHLSDLHVGLLTPHAYIRRAVELARAERPDLVLLTGDYVCYSPKFVDRLGEIVAGLEAPTVCVLGNHDYWTSGSAVTQALARNHYDVLRNQHTRIELNHAPLTIVGIDDAITGHADTQRAFRGVPPQGSRLVLTHAPALADAAAAQGPSLILAGHTHGGHVYIPRVTAGLLAAAGNPYLAGFYRVGDSLLYVNRGVGASSVPIRAGAPAEVSLLTLRAAPP